ncbi:hypothetical protein J4G48_0046015 [Bradyrhizobium barranii subsp. apii]|uniref:hypothetical protein n=1 Tax=Bradyrhizobium barranii TaxID=2992140 RepID=UPI001AA0BDEC|nr:hypothetical protein [Bradyrhizobium barranii]UPT96297.1 hypothetical protein J4G48_0046015 [Bradyrhizobium barranii subsp. apii]
MDWLKGLQPSTATLIAAGITFAGTVVLVPLLNWLISWIREKRSQLLVILNWNEVKRNEQLTKVLTDLVTEGLYQKDRAEIDAKLEIVALFRTYFNARSYMHFVVTNQSRRVFSNLTFFDTKNFVDLYQVHDDEVRRTEKNRPVSLGDLQPGRTIDLHVWDSSTVPIYVDDSAQRFKFSADELDHVKMVEPLPPFMRRRYQLGVAKYVTIVFWAVFVMVLLSAFVK